MSKRTPTDKSNNDKKKGENTATTLLEECVKRHIHTLEETLLRGTTLP